MLFNSAFPYPPVHSKLVSSQQVLVSDPNSNALAEIKSSGIAVTNDNARVAEQSNILFMCTKPDIILPALQAIASRLKPNVLIVSIAAGLTLESIESIVPNHKVVRVMPNTPALVGASASAFTIGQQCNDEDGALVQRLLSSIGLAVRVNEKDLNGVTGLSGSGPAFVFMFIEALADGGVRSGLTRTVAMQLAIQTVLGSAKLMESTGKHPGQLKDQVASPGGTTIAGIHALEHGALRSTVMDAVFAAANRAKELGQPSKIKSKL